MRRRYHLLAQLLMATSTMGVTLGGGAAPVNTPPSNVSAPTISGTPQVGSLLTASTGFWSGNPAPTYTYQWRRAGVSISGATSATYTVVSADVGQSITVTVTATNSQGSASATSAAVTGQAGSVAPSNSTAPAISGTPQVGSLLTASTGVWAGSPTPTYTYQWNRAGVAISGATASTYTVVTADISQAITVTVTATNTAGSASATSASVTGQAAASFSPATLFAASELGVWYDPSDLTTMYQDIAETVPVTAYEQTVAVIRDKSRTSTPDGPQLVSNGTFDTATTGWTAINATIASVAGELEITGSGGFYPRVEQTVSVTAGKMYRVSITMRRGTATAGVYYNVPGLGDIQTGATTNQTYVSLIRPSGSSIVITLGIYSGGASGTVYFDNISVREITTNHAYQVTSGSRPVVSARVNLLTRTEELENSAWSKLGVTVTANQTTSPTGTSTADLAVVNNGAQANVQLYNQLSVGQSSTNMTLSGYVKKSGASYASIGWIYAAGTYCAASFNLDTQTLTRSDALGGFTIVGTPSITALANGWFRISITATTPSTSAFSIFPGIWPRVNPWTSGTPDAGDTGNGTSGIFIWGVDLRPANSGVNIPVYQRVAAATDYDTVGFPSYLRFDGSDDFLESAYFAMPGPYSVWAGIRTNVTNLQCIVNSDDGISPFMPQYLRINSSALESIAFASGGTSTDVGPAINTTDNFVLAANCSTTNLDATVNGVSNGTTAISGTLSAVSRPITIGRYTAGGFFFNGRLYGAIVRGAASTSAQMSDAGNWMNGKTGAY